MSDDRLEALRALLEEDLDGVSVTPGGLRSVVDTRYGEITIRVDPDEEEQDENTVALRVHALIPTPVGAGSEFLVWCLTTNVEYWGVKIGIDEDGMMSVHADLEVVGAVSIHALAAEIIDRSESVQQLLDEDLVEYCLAHGLGTPQQRARWKSHAPSALGDDDEEDE